MEKNYFGNLYKWFLRLLHNKSPRRPPPDAIKEALKQPNGWVYEIDGGFKYDDAIPPQAIKGAWKVNKNGVIVGEFVPNPNYVDVNKL